MRRGLRDNIALLLDLYELTMAQGYWKAGKQNQLATFDLFVRKLPVNRGYLINAGLEDALDYISNLRFSPQDIAYLRKQRIFSSDFLDYLAGFKFGGDVWAMPEGELFFANQPVIRVTAKIIEAQILESFLLNTVNLQAMLATKASRVVLAAQGRRVFDFSLRRTHGQDAGLKAARSSFLAGFSGTSNVASASVGATLFTAKLNSVVTTPPLPSSAVIATTWLSSGPSVVSNDQVQAPALPASWVIVPIDAVIVTLSLVSTSANVPLLAAV